MSYSSGMVEDRYKADMGYINSCVLCTVLLQPLQ